MGNYSCVIARKKQSTINPLLLLHHLHNQQEHEEEEEEEEEEEFEDVKVRHDHKNNTSSPSTGVRVKVRMTKTQLQDFMFELKNTKHEPGHARILFHDCLNGKFTAQVCASQPAITLTTIMEDE
ncbi:hypothetical protein M5689_004590 [Euphorbia peplus]|nr:hypothetical protein M5689_004590 [Euphorbia peplus]